MAVQSVFVGDGSIHDSHAMTGAEECKITLHYRR